jgi:RNA-binding protein Musashi
METAQSDLQSEQDEQLQQQQERLELKEAMVYEHQGLGQPQPHQKGDSSTSSRKIFIGGLSYATDDEKLRSYFARYGQVLDAVVMKDPVSRRSRGFGFITYSDIESLEKVSHRLSSMEKVEDYQRFSPRNPHTHITRRWTRSPTPSTAERSRPREPYLTARRVSAA